VNDGPTSHWHPEPSEDFDWDAVEREVDGPTADLDPDQRKRLAEAFLRVIQWQLRGIEKPSPGGTKGKARTIGIRAIALAYMLNPAILGGNRNAAQIARDLGVSRKTMAVTIQSAREHLWGIGRG
jgi:hypothetical protein